MSKKSGKIAALIEDCRGQGRDAHYLGYFACFHRQLFYEAHDVLEELWLEDRNGPDGDFYKGLIQLAGAFVHLQKHTLLRPRLKPSGALFRLAQKNLEKYPARHHGLDLRETQRLIAEWLGKLEAGQYLENPLGTVPAPVLGPIQ